MCSQFPERYRIPLADLMPYFSYLDMVAELKHAVPTLSLSYMNIAGVHVLMRQATQVMIEVVSMLSKGYAHASEWICYHPPPHEDLQSVHSSLMPSRSTLSILDLSSSSLPLLSILPSPSLTPFMPKPVIVFCEDYNFTVFFPHYQLSPDRNDGWLASSTAADQRHPPAPPTFIYLFVLLSHLTIF